MIYLFDNQKTLIGEIPRKSILNYEQKQILGGAITSTVTAIYTPDIEQAFYFGSKDIDDENIFWIYRITSQTKQDGKITLTGIYLLFDELQGEVVRDIRPQNLDPATALGRILEGSSWQVGTSTATGLASGNFYYESRLASFYDFLKRWGSEFRPRITFDAGQITGRYIDLYDRISDDYGKRYEYGDKLIKVVAEQANEGIYTALIGRGKGEEVGDGYGRRITFADITWSVASGDPVDKPFGQDFVSIPSAVDIYGFREAVIEFPDIEDPEELLQETYKTLVERSRPRVEFSADVIETGTVELGEVVTIIRDDLGIRYQTRIFELTRNFLTKKVKSFRFGDRVFTTAAERIKQDREQTETQLKEQQSLIYAALEAITTDYWNEDGYNYELRANNDYGLPAGYYSFDRPIDQDPTKVVYMGAGKVLIATGKDPNGEWVWRTALTPEGLVGSEIIAHSITANQLAADVGQSLDLSSNEAITSRVTREELESDTELLNRIRAVQYSDTPPTETDKLWMDLSENRLKYWDGQEWVDDLSSIFSALGSKANSEDISQQLESLAALVRTTQSAVEQTAEDVNIEIREINTALDANGQKINELSDDISTNFNFSAEGLGIGKTDSRKSILISNDVFQILDDGTPVVEIDGKLMSIDDVLVRHGLIVGVHKLEKFNDRVTLVRYVGQVS